MFSEIKEIKNLNLNISDENNCENNIIKKDIKNIDENDIINKKI